MSFFRGAGWLLTVGLAAMLLPCGPGASRQAVASEKPDAAHLWQPCELTFTAERCYEDPFDFESLRLTATFEGPGGEKLELPGFWDGGQTWKIRFAPTSPGKWTYVTRFLVSADTGLHDRRGTIEVRPSQGDNPIFRHGGFLRVSSDGRYLTYTDGTPFFWLGDTWWCCPSANVPLECFRQMVDLRASQGYTVFQGHGHRPIFPELEPGKPRPFAPEKGMGAFQAVHGTGPEVLRYWREVDRYLAYANAKGMIGVMGFAGHRLLDPIALEDLKRLWHYYIARDGAYGVTFLITQEYNARIGNLDERLPKMLALGRFIKEVDPYRRAMTVHPWWHGGDGRQAWDESWLDFIMLQAGHRRFAPPEFYRAIYRREPARPFLESEANYEAFRNERIHVDAAAVRRSAYTAIQAGSFGFTYGAQGLYGGVLRREAPGPTARWGPVLTWEEGLALPGGAQMQHLRTCYESVAWWKLTPRPTAVVPACDILTKAEGDQTFLLYFLAGGKVPPGARLKDVDDGGIYAAEWFDPRTGRVHSTVEKLAATADGLKLPERPDHRDWMLILKK